MRFSNRNVAAGPTVNLSPDVSRPGALSDGDRLMLAAVPPSSDATGAVNAITVWTSAWGSAETPSVLTTIAKLSRLPPRRLRVARVGPEVLVAWTERVPASRNGITQYVDLLVAPVPHSP